MVAPMVLDGPSAPFNLLEMLALGAESAADYLQSIQQQYANALDHKLNAWRSFQESQLPNPTAPRSRHVRSVLLGCPQAFF
jgi:hypothetical protein